VEKLVWKLIPPPVTVAVLQPSYLPWLGYFDQLAQADHFVFYDDVQYDKHGWRNRNRIKSQNGPVWLTVPVLHAGIENLLIKDARIKASDPWVRKHEGNIFQNYRTAPYFKEVSELVFPILRNHNSSLCDLDIQLISSIAGYLGINTPIYRSSALGIEGGQSDRLLKICQHFGARRYISGDAAKDYLDTALFTHGGVEVHWHSYEHPTYTQAHGPFQSHLSILDLLMNEGKTSASFFVRKHSAQ